MIIKDLFALAGMLIKKWMSQVLFFHPFLLPQCESDARNICVFPITQTISVRLKKKERKKEKGERHLGTLPTRIKRQENKELTDSFTA